MKDDKLVEELIQFIKRHFHQNYDPRRYIDYSEFIDFIWENCDFNIIKVKNLLNSWEQLECHNGKVYGLYCFSYPDLNKIEDDATSTSEDMDDELYDSDDSI